MQNVKKDQPAQELLWHKIMFYKSSWKQKEAPPSFGFTMYLMHTEIKIVSKKTI